MEHTMITKYITSFFATGLAFAIIDTVWLRTMYTRLYQPDLGEILYRGGVRLGPAVAFYMFYILGIIIFAVGPALADGRWQTALVKGALFGFFCYMTYDLTNFATLKVWTMRVAVLDMIWGTILTGSAALAGWWITQKMLG
jgi:uncharacterized membrane protein